MYLEIDNKMPDSENKDGKKDIESLITKLGEISEVKDDKKNYIIDIRPDEQAATIIDLKLKVVVDVTIEDNRVIIESGVTDDIGKVVAPRIELTYDPKEPNTPIVTITITAEEENMGIAKIQFPDNTEKTYSNEKRLEIPYPVSENGPYKFVVVGANGRRATKTIEINNAKETAKIKTEQEDMNISTKNDVNIKITYDENPAYKGALLTNEDKYQYYSIEENEWKTAETNPITITVSKNGVLYARYYNGTEGFKSKTHTVKNIDKKEPKPFNLKVEETKEGIKVSAIGEVTDQGSDGTAPEHIGIQGYQFQLKDETGKVLVDWKPAIPQKEQSYTFTEEDYPIEPFITYKVSMQAVDLAGNEKEATNKDESIILENGMPTISYLVKNDMIKPGDIVNYPIPSGQTYSGQWKVLHVYKDLGTVEIISTAALGTKNFSTRGESSFQSKYVSTLNSLITPYVNTKYADRGRSVRN